MARRALPSALSPALKVEQLEDRLNPDSSMIPAGQFNWLQYSPTGELAELVWQGNALVFRDRVAGTWVGTTVATSTSFTQTQYDSTAQVENASRTAQLVFASDGTAHVLFLEKQWNGSLGDYETLIQHYERTSAGWQHVETIVPTMQSEWGPNSLVAVAGPNRAIDFIFTETSVPATAVGSFGTGTLNYATNASGAWSFSTIANTTDLSHDVAFTGARWEPRYLSLAVDSANNAYVTYTPEFYIAGAFSTVDSTLMYATNSGGSWQSEVVQAPIGGGPADAGLGASIAVSPAGQVAIASYYVQRYSTGSPQTSELMYHTLVNGNWTSTVVTSAPDGYVAGDGANYTGFAPELFFDSSGQPNIVFSDEAAQHLPVSYANEFAGQIRLASLSGSTWSLQTVFAQTDPIHNQLFYPVAAKSNGQITFAGLVATTTVDSNSNPITTAFALTDVNAPFGLASPPVSTVPPIPPPPVTSPPVTVPPVTMPPVVATPIPQLPVAVPQPVAPAPASASTGGWAVALDSGTTTSQVFVFRADGSLAMTVTPYGSGYTGGIRFARADLTGDGVPDLITVPTAGIDAQVRVFDGVTGALIAAFDPFPGYAGGLYVAAGDVLGKGRPALVVGSDEGNLPAVSVFDGNTLGLLAVFLPYAPGQVGGVRVAVGDIGGDGFADIVTAPGPGAMPIVNVYDGRSLAAGQGVRLAADFLVASPTMTAGVNLAVGDLEGNGYADVITGPSSGSGHIQIISGQALATGRGVVDVVNGSLWATGGLQVAAVDAYGDGHIELMATSESANGGYFALFGDGRGQWLDPLPGLARGIYVG